MTVHVGRFARLKPPEGNPVCTVTTQGYCSLCGDASVTAVEGALLRLVSYTISLDYWAADVAVSKYNFVSVHLNCSLSTDAKLFTFAMLK